MNRFEKRLQEFKNNENRFRILCELFELQINQFEYDGLPDTIPAEFLEFYMLINGTVAIGKTETGDDIYCAIGSYNDDYNGYLPKGYTAAVIDIGEISGDWYGENKSIVVGKNNNMGMPERDIPFTADIITQVDISETCNVIFSRFCRIPFADTDKEKTAIESAIKSIIKGDLTAIASRDTESTFEKFLEETVKRDDKFLDLVDVDKIDGLQYLNQYRDNVMKRFLTRRGYMVQTTAKLAQQTNSEIHGFDSYSFLYPLQQLKQREKMCNEMNTLFNLNVSVKFNPILQKVYDRFMTDPEQNENVSRETNDDNKITDPIDDTADDKPADDSTGGDTE